MGQKWYCCTKCSRTFPRRESDPARKRCYACEPAPKRVSAAPKKDADEGVSMLVQAERLVESRSRAEYERQVELNKKARNKSNKH